MVELATVTLAGFSGGSVPGGCPAHPETHRNPAIRERVIQRLIQEERYAIGFLQVIIEVIGCTVKTPTRGP
jgi:hypothetical protein